MKSNLAVNQAFYILLGIFILGLFMVFSLASKIVPLTISHTIYFCQKTLSNIIFTLPHSLPPLFVLVLLLIVFTGFVLLLIKLRKTYLFVGKILKHKISTPQNVEEIALKLEIAGKINVVKTNIPLSFCYGLFKPRICISLGLLRSLKRSELTSVLIHESYHLKNRDPLKILLSQIASSMFFFVPTLKDIHNYYTLSKEIAADQLAIKFVGVKNLRSALSKILISSTSPLNGIASFTSESDLEQRIQILTKAKKLSIKISFVKLFLSFMVFAASTLVLNLPVFAIEGMNDEHAYYICPFGDQCMSSCKSEGMIKEIPFTSSQSFSPLNYSPNTNISN